MAEPDLGSFLALERRVWDALARGDAEADARLLSEDFLGVYGTGFSTRAEHAAQLKDGPVVARYELSAARLLKLSPTLVLLAYEALWTRPSGEQRRYYISSIWERRGREWINVFSQDTPADPR